MRLQSVLCLSLTLFLSASACLHRASAQAQEARLDPVEDTASRYERTPGYARYQSSPGHEYRVAKARRQFEEREAMRQAYAMAGIDFAHPTVSGSFGFMVIDPPRYKQIHYSPRIRYIPTYEPSLLYPEGVY